MTPTLDQYRSEVEKIAQLPNTGMDVWDLLLVGLVVLCFGVAFIAALSLIGTYDEGEDE